MVVAEAKQISKETMEELLAKWQDIPMAHVLTTLFLENADTSNLWLRNDYDGKIYAPIKDKENLTICIWSMYGNRVDLEIYHGKLESVPQRGYMDVFFNELISFVACVQDAGVWMAGRGDQKTYAIVVHPPRTIHFPSEIGRWVFEFLHNFSLRATEFHLDVSQQPHFWDGAKKPY